MLAVWIVFIWDFRFWAFFINTYEMLNSELYFLWRYSCGHLPSVLVFNYLKIRLVVLGWYSQSISARRGHGDKPNSPVFRLVHALQLCRWLSSSICCKNSHLDGTQKLFSCARMYKLKLQDKVLSYYWFINHIVFLTSCRIATSNLPHINGFAQQFMRLKSWLDKGMEFF